MNNSHLGLFENKTWLYEIFDGPSGREVALVNYLGKCPDVIIPAEIDGISVIYLDPKLFGGISLSRHYINTDIKSLTFAQESKITLIPPDFCRGESYLRYVELPDSITIIGDNAFCDCSRLKFISTPENLIEIGERAFYRCYALQTLPISQKLQNIGEQAFANTTAAIQDIVLPATLSGTLKTGVFYNSAISSVDMSKTKIHTIWYEAFRRSQIRKAILSNETTVIGPQSFSDCFKLSEIRGEKNIAVISHHAFVGVTLDSPLRLLSLTSVSESSFKDSNVTVQVSKAPQDVLDILKSSGVNVTPYTGSKLMRAVHSMDDEER